MPTVRRKPKTLTDKLVLWERAYRAVLDELDRTASVTNPGTKIADVVAARVGAARTAAVLIQGVDDGDS